MFDLEASILQWKRDMRAAGITATLILDELEDHLRDEIENLTNQGESLAGAFSSATRSIGPADLLLSEFAKFREPLDFQKLKESRNWFLALLGLSVAGLGCVVFFNTDMAPAQRLSSLTALALLPGLAFSGRLLWRIFPVVHHRRSRNFILGTAAIPTLAWIYLNARPLQADAILFGDSLKFILWATCPAYGFLAGVSWGLQTALLKNSVASSALGQGAIDQ
jgi:hypothetical protein